MFRKQYRNIDYQSNKSSNKYTGSENKNLEANSFESINHIMLEKETGEGAKHCH